MLQKLLQKFVHLMRFKFTAHTWIFLALLLAFVFLRFYQLEERMPFGWDQIQNSWIMKNMIIDHRLPLEGQVVKGNSGFYIGPAYYYLLLLFYLIFKLDPIAAGVFAGVVAVLNFFVLYFVTKKIFSKEVALVALFFYTFSAISIYSDRIAWSVIFIPFVSVLIFYFLYQSLIGKSKNMLWLALITGFAFHVHFTAIFFTTIILFTLPILLRDKNSWFYGILSLPIFAIWFVPNFLAGRQNNYSALTNLATYLSIYYHGFHLVRFWQLTKDAFIQFTAILYLDILKPLSTITLPIFFLSLYQNKPKKETKILLYLFALWFLIPWIIFSVYSGEISDYYFILTRPLVFMVLAYLVYRLMKSNLVLLKLVTVVLLIYYAVINVRSFDQNKYVVLPKVREQVRQDLREGKIIPFHDGDPGAYLYYVETHKIQ